MDKELLRQAIEPYLKNNKHPLTTIVDLLSDMGTIFKEKADNVFSDSVLALTFNHISEMLNNFVSKIKNLDMST